MCYYNGQKVTKSEKIRLLDLEKILAEYDFLNRIVIDGFDYGSHAVLRPQKEKKDFDLVQMEWGFIPSWLKTRAEVDHFRKGGINSSTGKYEQPYITLNAIGEEVLDKKMFKEAVIQTRCIIISSGFFEWRHIFPVSKKTGKPLKTPVRYPYYIHLPENEYFYMAGIYNDWEDQETHENVQSSAILTADANELMEPVHNKRKRMPTILTEEEAYQWMFGTDPVKIRQLAARQYPHEKMYAYSLARDFLDSNDPLKRVDHPNLPPIPLPQYLKEAESIIIDDGDLRQGSLFN
jgi:putative SOS response-associated peptidase YedK